MKTNLSRVIENLAKKEERLFFEVRTYIARGSQLGPYSHADRMCVSESLMHAVHILMRDRER
jgi:hypothetical protein